MRTQVGGSTKFLVQTWNFHGIGVTTKKCDPTRKCRDPPHPVQSQYNRQYDIALRPGDILVFNPQMYHSVSSRADDAQHIWCLSLYLKTALVGGNDNSIQLNPLQQEIKKIAILK